MMAINTMVINTKGIDTKGIDMCIIINKNKYKRS
jgi:hypothetical protein